MSTAVAPLTSCTHATRLHQLPDFWKGIALQRLAGVLRRGGILRLRDLVFDFVPAEADARIEMWLAGAVSDPALGWTASELAEHVRTEFSTYSWLLEAMLERTGFQILERDHRPMPTAATRAGGDESGGANLIRNSSRGYNGADHHPVPAEEVSG